MRPGTWLCPDMWVEVSFQKMGQNPALTQGFPNQIEADPHLIFLAIEEPLTAAQQRHSQSPKHLQGSIAACPPPAALGGGTTW